MKGDEISALMRALGSKKSEISVFISIYTANKPLTAKEISERSKISEKTVRLCLKKLLERGYILSKKEGKKVLYHAKDPGEILGELKRKVGEKIAEIFSHLRFHR